MSLNGQYAWAMARQTGLEKAVEWLVQPWLRFGERHPVVAVGSLVVPGVTLMAFGLWWASEPSGWVKDGEFWNWEGPVWAGACLLLIGLFGLGRLRKSAEVTTDDADATAQIAEPQALDAIPGGDRRRRSERLAPASWYPDPRGEFEFRYWDGGAWTALVASGGVETTSKLPAHVALPGPQQPTT